MGFLTQKKSVNLYVCIVHYFALIKVKSLVKLLENGTLEHRELQHRNTKDGEVWVRGGGKREKWGESGLASGKAGSECRVSAHWFCDQGQTTQFCLSVCKVEPTLSL